MPNRSLRWSLLVLALIAAAGLSGCRKGPGTQALQQEIQEKLDRNFRPGLFVVDELKRRGSYPYSEEGDDRDRLLVYYDARIRFAQDYKLSDWDQLNVGSLIWVLGATPLGVEGVEPAGNRAGDVLDVYGTSAYVREGDEWTVAMHLPKEGAAGERRPPPERLAYQGLLEELGQVGKEVNRLRSPEEMALFEATLEEALAASRRRLGQAQGWVTVAAGTPGGDYYALGQALAETLRESDMPAISFRTGGSMENLHLVDRGEVLFAFAQNDVAHMAREGTGLFAGRLPLRNVRALCSLYPEAVQVVTLAESGIRGLEGLRGKRVDVGLPGSGVRVNALQVLAAAGMGPEDVAAVSRGSLADSLAALEAGEVDALFLTGAYPNHALLELAGEHETRLLCLSEPLVATLTEKHPFFIPVRVPANTYPGMGAACATVGVTAMLVTHARAADSRVTGFLQHLFGHVSRLAGHSLQAYYIARKTGRTGLSIPLHPAARRYLEPSDEPGGEE